jgi:Amt family ammonium transporter
VKGKLKIDDSLDVFAVHGLGGIIGTVLLAVFGTASFGGFGKFETGPQLVLQLKAVGVTVLWSAVATYAIARGLKAFGGLRVSPENEETGLDASSHGEKAYHI